MEMNEENKKRLEWIFEELLYSPRYQQPKGFQEKYENLGKINKSLKEFLKSIGYRSGDKEPVGFPGILRMKTQLENEYESLYKETKEWFKENFFERLTSRFFDYLEKK